MYDEVLVDIKDAEDEITQDIARLRNLLNDLASDIGRYKELRKII